MFTFKDYEFNEVARYTHEHHAYGVSFHEVIPDKYNGSRYISVFIETDNRAKLIADFYNALYEAKLENTKSVPEYGWVTS